MTIFAKHDVSSEPIDLTDKQFRAFRDLIYDRSGISLSENKRSLVRAKLSKRLRALGIADFGGYYRYVENDRSGEELVQLLDVISTNVTNFFREPSHFEFLKGKYLPEMIARKPEHPHIWSAACSTGEEPYTIAMTVLEAWPEAAKRGFKILATDISTAALAKAEAGEYPLDRVTHVPRPMLEKYFTVSGVREKRIYRVRDEVKSMIRFRHFNLNGAEWPFSKPFESIFCRNVMIYFDRETQMALIHRFTRHLRMGGMLFVGHSESLVGFKHDLIFVEPTVYRRGK